MTNLKKIKIPEGTMRSKVTYLLENYPHLSRADMAEILEKPVSTIYSYVSEIKKTDRRNALKSATKESTAKTKIKAAPQETIKEELPFEEVKEVMPLEVHETVEIEDYPLETTLLEEKHKLPANLEFSLTGVSGELLQRVLYNLLGNSLDASSEYSFVLTLHKTK